MLKEAGTKVVFPCGRHFLISRRMQSALALIFLNLTWVAVAHAKSVCEIISYVQSAVLTPLKALFLALAAFLFLYGVVEFIAGASSEEARTTGKRHMVWGLLGIVIILAVGSIITILTNFFGQATPTLC